MEASQSATQWYLFTEEDYSGPHTFVEAYRKVSASLKKGPVHVWSQPLKNWELVHRPFEFEDIAASTSIDGVSFLLEDAKFQENEFTEVEDFPRAKSFQEPLRFTEPKLQKSGTPSLQASDYFNRVPYGKWIAIATSILILTGLSYFLYEFQQKQNPLATIEILDVNPTDLLELRGVFSSQGFVGQAAIAMSQINTSEPSFFIASPLSEGSLLDVYVESIPALVSGMREISLLATVQLARGLGRTPNLKTEEGQKLPMGSYAVSVYCSNCNEQAQKGLKNRLSRRGYLLSQKQFFVGGPPTREYQAEIEVIRTSLKEKANLELLELTQIVEVIEKQTRSFKPAAFDSELRSYVKKNSSEETRKRLIYPTAYIRLVALIEQLETMEESDAGSPAAPPKSFSLSRETIGTELQTIKARIQLAQKALKHAEGLPPVVQF